MRARKVVRRAREVSHRPRPHIAPARKTVKHEHQAALAQRSSNNENRQTITSCRRQDRQTARKDRQHVLFKFPVAPSTSHCGDAQKLSTHSREVSTQAVAPDLTLPLILHVCPFALALCTSPLRLEAGAFHVTLIVLGLKPWALLKDDAQRC